MAILSLKINKRWGVVRKRHRVHMHRGPEVADGGGELSVVWLNPFVGVMYVTRCCLFTGSKGLIGRVIRWFPMIVSGSLLLRYVFPLWLASVFSSFPAKINKPLCTMLWDLWLMVPHVLPWNLVLHVLVNMNGPWFAIRIGVNMMFEEAWKNLWTPSGKGNGWYLQRRQCSWIGFGKFWPPPALWICSFFIMPN